MKRKQPKITITIEGDKVTLTMERGVPPVLAETIPDLIATALKTTTPVPSTSKSLSFLQETDSWSVREKVRYVVLRNCRHGWFNSKDVLELYSRAFHPSIVLATVCTYLSRMYKDGVLSRRGSTAQREYRVKLEELEDEIDSLLSIKVRD